MKEERQLHPVKRGGVRLGVGQKTAIAAALILLTAAAIAVWLFTSYEVIALSTRMDYEASDSLNALASAEAGREEVSTARMAALASFLGETLGMPGVTAAAYDSNGTLLAASGGVTDDLYSRREVVRDAMRQGADREYQLPDGNIFHIAVIPQSGAVALIVPRSLEGGRGKKPTALPAAMLKAVVAGLSADLATLQRSAESIAERPWAREAAVYDRARIALAHSDPTQSGKEAPMERAPAMTDAAASTVGRVVEGGHGIRLRLMPARTPAGAVVFIAEDTAPALAESAKLKTKAWLIALALALSALGLIMFSVKFFILDNVALINAAARDVADEKRVNSVLVSGNNELADLADYVKSFGHALAEGRISLDSATGHLDDILDAMSEPLLIVSAEGVIVTANRAAESLIGPLLPGQPLASYTKTLNPSALIASRTNSANTTATFTTASGKSIDLSLNLRTIIKHRIPTALLIIAKT